MPDWYFYFLIALSVAGAVGCPCRRTGGRGSARARGGRAHPGFLNHESRELATCGASSIVGSLRKDDLMPDGHEGVATWLF